MIRYKLTDENMCTYGGTQWEIGIPKSTSGKGELCGPGWLHCYSHPLLAVLLNPIHAGFVNPRLFKCKATGNHQYDNGLKEGSTTMELVKEIELPYITTIQKVAFGILCTTSVYDKPTYITWATNWLSNIDRTSTAAARAAARDAADYAARAADYAADYAAAYAADYAAAYAAYAADYAAYAADYAVTTCVPLNLIKIAKVAMTYT